MIVLCFLAVCVARPGPQAAVTEFTRAGIVCTEAVEPKTVPLIGEVRLTLTAMGRAPVAVDPVTFADPPGWRSALGGAG